MKLLDVLCAPWAIQPEKLLEIHAIYHAHVRGEKIDLAGVEQRLGRPLVNEPKRYEIVDGVAVVPIEGMIAKRANLFMQISGGTSTQLAAQAVRDAGADPQAHAVVLAIDSPGGVVDGLDLLSSSIRDVRASGKRVVSFADGMMASAAYWIGSAAESIVIADNLTTVGSIGVAMVHRDVSVAQERAGIKMTDIYAGKFKRLATENAPLSSDGLATLQARVDYVYSLFVAEVAKNRGVSVDAVLEDMADGRQFIGQQAIDAGLVDGMSSLQGLIAALNADRRTAAAQSKPTASTAGANTMDRTQLEAQHPDLFKALCAEFTAAGAEAERARIQAVEGACLPGHETLIASLKFDGKTSGGDAALAVMAAERKQRDAAAGKLKSDAPDPVKPAATPAIEGAAESVDPNLPVDERCKAVWERDAKVRAEFTSLQAFTAYTKQHEAGNVRVLGARKA
jgi:capsid assembly protease